MKKILKKCKQIAKSDLADEFVRARKRVFDEVLGVYEVFVDDKLSAKINKNKGRYVTIDTKAILNAEYEKFERITSALKNELRTFIKGTNVLVVGLGNYKLEADSLGVKTCDKVSVTRKIVDSDFCVSAIIPGVVGSTGIESFEIVKGVCEKVKPDTVIVVDSLCAGSVSRLLTTIQISDAGIVPGSGVSNHRMPLNELTLNAKVVSIGVPTVVYASTLINEFDGKPFLSDLVVSPKDIDFAVRDCAKIISGALNSLFGVFT